MSVTQQKSLCRYYGDNVTAVGGADAELRVLKSEGHAVFDPLERTKNI